MSCPVMQSTATTRSAIALSTRERRRAFQGRIWPSEGHNFVQLFIQVDSVADYVSRAERLGARAIIPPQTLPEGNVLAVMHDPQGIPFGLLSKAKKK